LAYFDKDEDNFPSKGAIKREWRRLAKELTEEDAFVFYFSGHGIQVQDKDGDEEDNFDEAMLFVEPDGTPKAFVDDEVAELLALMNPKTRVLAITDCCHSGTLLDLDKPELHGRPIFHFAAALDYQEAVDLGGGGAFTTCILETLKRTSHDEREKSVAEIYNTIVGKYQKRYVSADQIFQLSFPIGADPDTCPWPILPHRDWTVVTQFDGQVCIRNREFYVPGMQGAKMIRKISNEGKLVESTRKKAEKIARASRSKTGRSCSEIQVLDLMEGPTPVYSPTCVYKPATPVYQTLPVYCHSAPAPISPQARPTLLGYGASYMPNVTVVRYGGC